MQRRRSGAPIPCWRWRWRCVVCQCTTTRLTGHGRNYRITGTSRLAHSHLTHRVSTVPISSVLGSVIGTTLGGMQIFERWLGGSDVVAGEAERIPYHAPAVRLARTLGCRGPVAIGRKPRTSGEAPSGCASH